MGGVDLLRTALLAEAILFAAAVAGLFGHAVAARWRARRDRVPLARARRAVRDAAAGRTPDAADAAALASLPRQLRTRTFVELAPRIAGAGRRRLTALAGGMGMVASAEARCGSRRWWRRLHAVRFLEAVGGGTGVVPALLEDRHPAVRAAAVEWSAGHPAPEVVERLARMLERPDRFGGFVLRDALIRIGTPAVQPLARHLERTGGPASLGALDVAAALPDPRYRTAARIRAADAHPEVRRGACRLLGALGGAGAVDALRARLDDSDEGVRAAAAAALGRLGDWVSAPALAARLRDPAWAVRRGAALALRALGAPGVLYLRRGLSDADGFAADIARQVLELPAGAPTGGTGG
jgi:hypothetical protein